MKLIYLLNPTGTSGIRTASAFRALRDHGHDGHDDVAVQATNAYQYEIESYPPEGACVEAKNLGSHKNSHRHGCLICLPVPRKGVKSLSGNELDLGMKCCYLISRSDPYKTERVDLSSTETQHGAKVAAKP